MFTNKKCGIAFRVLLHIDCIKDFASMPNMDGGSAITSF
jgi:hypothetical protein